MIKIFLVLSFVSASIGMEAKCTNQDSIIKEYPSQEKDSLEILWNIMVFENGRCLGGQQYFNPNSVKHTRLVFSEKEWLNFSNHDKEELTDFLILKLADTAATKIHTCPFGSATVGEMAIYCLQHLHKTNWQDFKDFKEYKKREATSSTDNAQYWIQNILADEIKREKLAELYRNEMKK